MYANTDEDWEDSNNTPFVHHNNRGIKVTKKLHPSIPKKIKIQSGKKARPASPFFTQPVEH